MRPDAVGVWMDVEVCRRLSWYRKVMTGVAPAKFMLCKKIPAQIEEHEDAWENLWIQHRALSGQLDGLVADVERGLEDGWGMKDASPNLLDLKSILVHKMLRSCNFCEWNCRVDRVSGEVGFCRLDKTTSVSSYFHHYGEEAPPHRSGRERWVRNNILRILHSTVHLLPELEHISTQEQCEPRWGTCVTRSPSPDC